MQHDNAVEFAFHLHPVLFLVLTFVVRKNIKIVEELEQTPMKIIPYDEPDS